MNKINNLRIIRQRLGMTQKQIAKVFDVSTMSIHLYEKGAKDLPAECARRLIELCKSRGSALNFDDIYDVSKAGLL